MKKKRKKKPRSLLYKVVELSTVDEGAIERTLNEWVPQGWRLDGVQFAMRESSKRPSMAFVFFTREGASVDGALAGERAKMPVLSSAEGPVAVSAWDRLAQLAGEGEES